MSQSAVLTFSDWNVNAVKYMTPKINDKGGKAINVISTQTNRTLTVTTPLLMTWGVSDFADEKGEQDGKFMISMVFPNDDYGTAATRTLLEKIKNFEEKFLDDAVKNSESWFGEKMSREIVKHMFFPILKYPKNKDTKKFDYSKQPTIKAKVPVYNGKWDIEIYDTKSQLIFPNSNPDMTPMDFIPKNSTVACVLAFTQVWVGGKGMGIQLKLVQCIVKPRENVSTIGKCQIMLSQEDLSVLENDADTMTESVAVGKFKSVEQVVEPVVKSVVEPVVKSVVEPVVKSVVEPVVKSEVEPVVESVVEPVVESVVEPVVESVVMSVVEEVVKSVVEPVIIQVPLLKKKIVKKVMKKE